MDNREQAGRATASLDRKTQIKINLVAFAITVLVLGGILAAVLAAELGGWGYLHWASAHPALRAKYDPHHWLGRLAVFAVLVSFCHAMASTLREPLATFIAWRRVFVPLPWERRREPEPSGAEPPSV